MTTMEALLEQARGQFELHDEIKDLSYEEIYNLAFTASQSDTSQADASQEGHRASPEAVENAHMFVQHMLSIVGPAAAGASEIDAGSQRVLKFLTEADEVFTKSAKKREVKTPLVEIAQGQSSVFFLLFISCSNRSSAASCSEASWSSKKRNAQSDPAWNGLDALRLQGFCNGPLSAEEGRLETTDRAGGRHGGAQHEEARDGDTRRVHRNGEELGDQTTGFFCTATNELDSACPDRDRCRGRSVGVGRAAALVRHRRNHDP